MRVYLDLCCLKRPFDDLSQARVRLESEAVLSLMACGEDRIQFVRSAALDVENDQNPLPRRAERVRRWLEAFPVTYLPEKELEDKVSELIGLGFKAFDSLHLASSELARAEVFASCDDGLLTLARRLPERLKVRVLNPIDLSAEVLP
jgi:hypothetical protein